jgi:hypothetical protein
VDLHQSQQNTLSSRTHSLPSPKLGITAGGERRQEVSAGNGLI